MPELRQDPTSREWIVIAVERTKRPDEIRELTTAEPASRASFGLVIRTYINTAVPEGPAAFMRETIANGAK